MKAVPTKQRRVTLKLTQEQFKAIEQRAELCGVHTSVWVRSIVVQAASQVSEDGYIRKLREPNGALT
jgi:uncharacterized protein (DUF1778 family)